MKPRPVHVPPPQRENRIAQALRVILRRIERRARRRPNLRLYRPDHPR